MSKNKMRKIYLQHELQIIEFNCYYYNTGCTKFLFVFGLSEFLLPSILLQPHICLCYTLCTLIVICISYTDIKES
jgi:hypothetical protein